jgi:hypothetical protein
MMGHACTILHGETHTAATLVILLLFLNFEGCAMGQSNWVWLEGCRVKKITAAAILIEYDDEEHWIPISQIDQPDRLEQGDEDITIGVTEWIAKQKGIQ